METTSKINLKIGEIEVTIEGTADFVSKQYDKVLENLESYAGLKKAVEKKAPQNVQTSPTVEEIPEVKPTATEEIPEVKPTATEEMPKVKPTVAEVNDTSTTLPGSFEEYLSKIPKNSTAKDIAFLAGYFKQISNPDNTFKVRDITRTIKGLGIKLSNPSNMIGLAAKGGKYISEVSKEGKQTNYHFTEEGNEYVHALLNGKTKKTRARKAKK